ncbi:class V chitinase CHIT5b-like [Lotus japonicus]|uniref:class V chitinase CHIT5b-like n=1 Tax=Lotus japonicus TaxID=34305 RepID=UPI002582E4B6|nr:class V chitinase CHIT5b-like [Lotus japonicus]
MAILNHMQFFFVAILFALTTKISTCTTTSSVKGIYWLEQPLFPSSSINTSLFTHVFYAFLQPNNVTYKLDIPTSTAAKLTAFTATMQAKTSPASTLISIGGAVSYNALFAFIASNPAARAAFITSTINAARTFGFDGLDFDWEYPRNATEMNDLGSLLKDWRLAVNAESSATGLPPLLLTAAVYFAADVTVDGVARTYPVASFNQNLDFVNVMTYDLHGAWSNETGAPAGLFDPDSNLSVAKGLVSWIRSGAIPAKLVMGLPLYGRTWQLRDPNLHGIGAEAVGVGPGLDGAMAYFQVLDFIEETGAKVVYDVGTVSVYSHSGSNWVGYDDLQTVAAKVGFAQALSLRGYFFWAAGLDTTDWKISTHASKAWRLA